MSLSGRDDTVVVDTTGWRGEHQATRAEEKYMREAPEAPVLTQDRLRSLEERDPMAAALLSVVSSLPPYEDAPDPDSQAAMEKVATAKVKAWRKAGRKDKEKEPMKAYPMFGTTWAEGFQAPYGEISATTSNDSSEWKEDWISRELTPSLPSRPRPLSPRGVCPEPVRVERGLPARMAAPKLGLNETMELLSRVPGAGDEDPDLGALSAALKAKLRLSELKKPPSTMSPGVELLTRGLKSCRGIRSTPLDTCPSPFHPRVRTVPVCTIGDSTEAEMEGYGLALLAPLATVYPSPPSGGEGDTGVPGRGKNSIVTANLQIELPEFHPKYLPEWAEEFSEFLLLTGQQHADVRTKCTLIKKSCKKKFLQRQVKTAIRKTSSWGDFLKRLEQMYPVYETDLSVRTEIEELPPLPEFPTAARISEFVAQLEELMGRMNPSSYGPTEPHLWLVGKIPPRTWESCKQTSERKSWTHSYNELVDLLIELAMERVNDSHMDKYLRKHLRREAPAEKPQGGRSPQPDSNPGKGKGGQLKHMKETIPAKGKGAPNLFYFRLQTTRGDHVTPLTAMDAALVCSSCGGRRRPRMVRRSNTRTTSAALSRAATAARGGTTRMSAT